MPSQNRFWRDDGSQLPQSLAVYGMSLHGEQSTLIVIEQQSLLSELLQQCFYLCVLELDDLLLPLIDHATEGSEQNVPWLEHEGHVRRRKSSVSDADRRNQAAEMRDSESMKMPVFHGVLSSAEFFDPTWFDSRRGSNPLLKTVRCCGQHSESLGKPFGGVF